MWSKRFLVFVVEFCFVDFSVAAADATKTYLTTTADNRLHYLAIDSTSVITCSSVPGTNDSIPVQNVRWLGPDDTNIITSFSKYGMEPIFQYRQNFNPNVISLKFSDLNESQGGIYKCLGDYGDTLLETSVEVLPFHDFAIAVHGRHREKEVRFFVNISEGVIDCPLNGRIFPNITWYKNGALYVPDSNRCRIEPANVIKCNPVINSDAGNYTFSGSISSPIYLVKNQTFIVKVMSWPHIHNLPSEIQVAVKGTVKLTCSATGAPTPTYKWLGVDSKEYTHQRGYQVDVTSGTLVISEAYIHDAGLLTCIATNSVGTSRRKVKLVVSTQPEVETTSPSLEQVTSLIDYVKRTHERNRNTWKVILGLVVTVSILIVIFIVDVSCYVTKRRGLMAILVRHSWNGGQSTNEKSLE